MLSSLKAYVLAVFALVLCMHQAEAKCKLHHADWKVKSKGPVVTQVSSSHPDKVKVSWNNQLNNQRCIDKYTVFYWRKDLDQPYARSVNLTGPNHSSVTLDIDSCLTYAYQVESIQYSFWTSKVHKKISGITQFKTSGIATINSLDKTNVMIGYQMKNGVHDLSTAVVTFRRDALLRNANCISELRLKTVKQIKDINGAQAKRRMENQNANSSSHGATGGEMNVPPPARGQTGGQFNVPFPYADHCGKQNLIEKPITTTNNDFRFIGKRQRHKRQSERDSSSSSGQTGGIFNDPNANGGTGGTFNDRDTNGGTGGTFNDQGTPWSTGGIFNDEGTSGGTGGIFNDDASSQEDGYYNDPSSNYQRASYCQNGNCNGRQRRDASSTVQNHNIRLHSSPPIAEPLISNMAVSATPPLNDVVTMEVGVPGACNALQTVFDLDVVSQSGRSIGHFKNLTLPPIDLTEDFQMPSLQKVMHLMIGCKIPKECAPLYMHAIDRNTNEMQEQLKWFEHQYKLLESSQANGTLTPSRANSTRTPKVDKNRMLKKLGCDCHMSKYIKVNVTDANVNYYYPNISGIYEFSGKTYDNKPYYIRNVTRNSAYMVYYYQHKQSWYIDDNLGDSSPKLAMDLPTASINCPADKSITNQRFGTQIPPTWSYVKSLIWKTVNSISVSCGVL